ncbi:MAG: amino acid adenylation domain-containing protein [Candidatus Eisenbacteria bacterium]
MPTFGPTLVHLLRRTRSEHPDRIAVRSAEGSLRYRELGVWADRIAARLEDAGIGEGDRVGLWMEKTPLAVAAIWAILLRGAAYVPLDPRSPQARAAAIVSDGELAALLLDGDRCPQLTVLLDAAPTVRCVLGDRLPEGSARDGVDVTGFPDAPAAGEATTTPVAFAEERAPDPESPAYVLYTSGSTGRPKGVVLSHRAAIAFTDWAVRTFSLGAEDRLSNHAPFHFDLSTFDLYGAFAVGASVRLIKPLEAMLAPWLARMIREEGITIWYSVPSVLAAMAQSTPELARAVGPQLRWMLFAGEVFPTPQLRALRDAVPQVRLGNLFGPTETNVCTWYEVCELPEGDAPIPIGKVCDHLTGSIRGEDGREVAPGAVGLLWIAGGNLLSGYWGDADLTRQRMARGSDDRLFYNTGDLVRRSADGTLIFQGRRDHLVKVRGYRVELGEVEPPSHAARGCRRQWWRSRSLRTWHRLGSPRGSSWLRRGRRRNTRSG